MGERGKSAAYRKLTEDEIRALLSGDEHAIQKMYDSYLGLAGILCRQRSISCGHILNEFEIEDIVQSVLTKLITDHLSRFTRLY